ncbi:MAG TPA: adenylate/guanylate cyclase domain-containing protein [Chthoniobacterales bacterium]|jgi:class 3 adenylate cyclase|nr:adenylate/guanylate cyclase domain-containing protein [Chthoniobacterales bacterium]
MSSVSDRAHRISLRSKVVLAMATVAALIVAAILATNFHFRRVQLLQEFQAFVRGAAGTTALALDGDAISTIHSPNDASLPAFQRTRQILDQSRRINHLAENEMYILRPTGASPFETEFVVMLQKKTFIGSQYSVPMGNWDRFLDAWNSGQPTSSDIYEDENGRWISGYAPIFNRAGRPVAMVEADARISRYLERQRAELLLGLAIGAAAFLIAMIPGLLLARNITGGLNKLSAGIRRFQSGEHDVQVEVRSGDELQHLGSVFNEMIVSLGEKLALLPYVSRFTAEAVRRSRHDPQWLAGMEQEVIVLFADLRGFTSWCETREAAFLVRELNRLLALQADAVVSAGGDVDKFIGDAVMAVFLGEEGSAEKVFACARELIAAIRQEIEAENWPLAVGVGIHRGHAVVGSIGSDTRRDFTAIGHTVNLASRLCDRAGKWQILVSEPFHEMLSAETRMLFERTAPMEFKHVSQAVATYRYTVPVAGIAEAPPLQPA